MLKGNGGAIYLRLVANFFNKFIKYKKMRATRGNEKKKDKKVGGPDVTSHFEKLVVEK